MSNLKQIVLAAVGKIKDDLDAFTAQEELTYEWLLPRIQTQLGRLEGAAEATPDQIGLGPSLLIPNGRYVSPHEARHGLGLSPLSQADVDFLALRAEKETPGQKQLAEFQDAFDPRMVPCVGGISDGAVAPVDAKMQPGNFTVIGPDRYVLSADGKALLHAPHQQSKNQETAAG